MLVLSRKKDEEIVLRLEPAATAAFREWLHRLPIDQERLTEGMELLDDLRRMEISLLVVSVFGDKARIGIDAPRDLVEVHRREILDLIETQQRERRLALQTA